MKLEKEFLCQWDPPTPPTLGDDKRVIVGRINACQTREDLERTLLALHIATHHREEPSVITTLRAARAALVHDAPGSCWATGPRTGDPVQDLVVCPGCSAIKQIDATLANLEGKRRNDVPG